MESFLFLENGKIVFENDNINKVVLLLFIMDCCDYDDVRRRLESGEMKITSCYDPKIGNTSDGVRKLPGLFPDFEETFKNSIRRLEKLS